MSTRYWSVFGLGFGDCGKGRFVDELCPRLVAHTVVRYNGGGQAGHTVVRADGRAHTFAHFGAGTFHPGVATLLAAPMVIHPLGLLGEAGQLRTLGLGDPLKRLAIDARCRLITPYLQAAGRLRELRLGTAGHGTCGIGFGETVRLDLESPELTLTYGELADENICRDRLEAQRQTLVPGFADLTADDPRLARERAAFVDTGLAERWLELCRPLRQQVPALCRERVRTLLTRPGAVLFEGAQGLLLDEDHGFHPHTTWSRVGPAAAEAVLTDAGIEAGITHLGVLRSYLTRHGAGPFPTHDPRLDALPEPHNVATGWQGLFRRGHPDLVLLRYALLAAPRLAGLLISHLDAVGRNPQLHWCDAYLADAGGAAEGLVERGPGGEVRAIRPAADLAGQTELARFLGTAHPRYEARPIADAAEWVERAAAIAGVPILLQSFGPLPGQVSGPLAT